MSRNISWSKLAWGQYTEWQKNDLKIVGKINDLIADISREPFKGLGKPEGLKGNFAGWWSRRITDEHRLVYKVDNEHVKIASCKGHYDDK